MGIVPERGDCFFKPIAMCVYGNIVACGNGLVDELGVDDALQVERLPQLAKPIQRVV